MILCLLSLVAAASVLLAVGCSSVSPSGADPSPLELILPSEPLSLDPRFATDAYGVRLTRLLHSGLFSLNPTSLEPTPAAVRAWHFEPDGALVLMLRDDVKFASGAPFEGADVCATLRAVADPALGSPHRLLVAALDACEVQGPHQVRLHLRVARATLLTDLELPILRRDQAAGSVEMEGRLDGLGPYEMRRTDRETLLLTARAGSVVPRPAHDVRVRVVRDENARALRFLAKRADVVVNALSPASLHALADRGVAVVTRPGANLTYLLPHHERSPFHHQAVRQALALALDRDTLVTSLLGGRARVAQSFVPPESWAFPSAPAPIRYDPASARERFEQAGVRRLSLLVSTDRARGLLARALAQMLGDVGVQVDVVPLELGMLLHRLNAGEFELALLQIPELTEPNLLSWFFHSSAIPGKGAGANRARYKNLEVDTWLDEASQTNDRSRRRVAYDRALTQMGLDLPVIPLFHEDQVAVLSPRASAFTPSAEGRWGALAAVP